MKVGYWMSDSPSDNPSDNPTIKKSDYPLPGRALIMMIRFLQVLSAYTMCDEKHSCHNILKIVLQNKSFSWS